MILLVYTKSASNYYSSSSKCILKSFKIILRNFFTDSSKDGVLGSSCESMTDIRLSMRYFPKFPLSERSLNLLLLLLHNHRSFHMPQIMPKFSFSR